MCSCIKNTNYTCRILQLTCQNGGLLVVVNCVRSYWYYCRSPKFLMFLQGALVTLFVCLFENIVEFHKHTTLEILREGNHFSTSLLMTNVVFWSITRNVLTLMFWHTGKFKCNDKKKKRQQKRFAKTQEQRKKEKYISEAGWRLWSGWRRIVRDYFTFITTQRKFSYFTRTYIFLGKKKLESHVYYITSTSSQTFYTEIHFKTYCLHRSTQNQQFSSERIQENLFEATNKVRTGPPHWLNKIKISILWEKVDVIKIVIHIFIEISPCRSDLAIVRNDYVPSK